MGLSFLRGLAAAVNPCGFILLPTYLMYFLGLQGQHPGTQRASIRRGLVVSGAVSAGFLTVFLAVGLISVHFTQWINQNARYATVVIGVALIVLGVAMLFGYKLPISTPRLDAGGRERTVASMFVYGIAYAVASIGCSIGLFIATLFTRTRTDGVLSGIANFVAYGTGMALLVTALTITLAVANTGLLRVLRTGMRHVESIAAVFVVLSGLYLVYYFWVVDVNEDSAPITNRVEDLQNWIYVRLSNSWQTTALLLGAIVAAAIVFVVVRRDDGDDSPAAEPTG
ncbi:MAG TPA: cytochrome c biogenesis CcdA family protein [Ilumatobacteraceae bacterium]|nr:cytochrome c biogenesis CcdA family protein [Ilumatobacteraceae bacterium]